MATEYGDISPRTAAYASMDFLSYAEGGLVLQKFAQSKPIPKNKTDTIKFRRPVPFGALTAPLVEGVTPTAQSFSYVDVTVQLLQWGAVNQTTDKVADTHEDPVLQHMSELGGVQAAETVEAVLWGVVRGGTNVIYTNGASRAAVNTVVDRNDIRKAVRFLKAQRGKKHTSMLSGSENFNTTPIEAAFIAFCHTDLDADVRNITGFTPLAEYGQRQAVSDHELGCTEDVRFITSPLLTPFLSAGGAYGGTTLSANSTNSDVYPIVIVAKESYGAVPLKGMNAAKPMVLNPNTPSKSDPLGQRGYVSWKYWFNAVILNQAWIIRIESAASAL